MAASRKVQVISTKYFMCINWGHYVIYLQNMKFERLILWPEWAYTDAMHFLIHESWLHRLIGKYPKWAKNPYWIHIVFISNPEHRMGYLFDTHWKINTLKSSKSIPFSWSVMLETNSTRAELRILCVHCSPENTWLLAKTKAITRKLLKVLWEFENIFPHLYHYVYFWGPKIIINYT